MNSSLCSFSEKTPPYQFSLQYGDSINSGHAAGTAENMRMEGAVRRMRTSLCYDSGTVSYSAQRPRHSARAALRDCLNWEREVRERSWLKWVWPEA